MWKTKNTAIIRQINAARWFHLSVSPWKNTVTNSVNTVSDITSWIILSCMILNGPPLPSKPIRLAGTWHEYSGSASSHDNRMMTYSGVLSVNTLTCCSLRCPYQAKVIKMLDTTSRPIV